MSVTQTPLASTKHVLPLSFGHNGPAANTTLGTIPITATGGGTLGVYEYTMPWSGSVIAVTARIPTAPTAGTLTLQPRINGSLTAFTTQKHVNSADIQAFVGKQDARIATSAFAAGDRVGLSFTTASDWAAINPIECQVFVLLEGVNF